MCLTPDGDFDDAPLVGEFAEQQCWVVALGAGGDGFGGQGTQCSEQIGRAVDTPGRGAVGETLQFQFNSGHHIRVEQIPQRRLAEELAEELAVDGEGHGASFGSRGVVLVHVRGDEVEHE